MNNETDKHFPGHTDEAYPEVFNKMIPQPTEIKPGQLPEHMIKQFFEEGYLLVEDFLPKELLEECKQNIDEMVEDLAQKLYKAGKIKNLYSDVDLFQRLTKIENEFPGANIVLHKYPRCPKSFQKLFTYEPLLNVIEQLIGPEIAAHPVWNLRTKTPQNEATTVPWHQDVGYLDNRAYQVMQATAWIPFLDTTVHNGCMQVVEKGHKTGKVADHQCCYGGTWYVMLFEDEMEKKLELIIAKEKWKHADVTEILDYFAAGQKRSPHYENILQRETFLLPEHPMDADVDVKRDVRTCPVPYGGMLLINNLIPHRSLSNLSNDIRWSADLRWQNPNYTAGFYDLKESLLLRSPKHPNLKVDWESWNSVDRQIKAKEMVQSDIASIVSDSVTDEEFDTTITGPWMKKWDLIHMNRHTEKMFSDG